MLKLKAINLPTYSIHVAKEGKGKRVSFVY